MNVRRFSACVLLAMGFVGVASASSAAQLLLTVSTPAPLAESGTASVQLRLGLLPGATDGFDNRWDLVAPASPASTSTVSVGIEHPAYPSGRQSLVWDFRNETMFPQEWTVAIASDQSAPVTLTWTTPDAVVSSCTSIAWTLADLTDGTVPLNLASSAYSSYSFEPTAGSTRRLIVRASASAITPPPLAPINFWSPRQGRSSVYLAWSGGGPVDRRYHVYREGAGGPIRLTVNPQRGTSYIDAAADTASSLTYWVTAVDGQGCESGRSVHAVVAPRR
ncbi:MAG: hypothetical protein ABIO65_12070 [Nitrospiria bacterium]